MLAAVPRHPAVVRLLAAFLSEERNESYLLLADAGQGGSSDQAQQTKIGA